MVVHVHTHMCTHIHTHTHIYTHTHTHTHTHAHTQWQDDSERIREQGSKIIDLLAKAVTVTPSDEGLPGTGCIQQGYEVFERQFDAELGGFGKAPKFPQPGNDSD